MSTFFSKLLTRMQARGGSPRTASAGASGRPDTGVDPAHDRHERDGFALRIRSILGAVGVVAELDGDQFALRVGPSVVSWLGAWFDDYQHASDDDRERIVLHAARAIVDASRPSPVPPSLAAARPHLRPRIRLRAHLVIERLQLEADGADPDGLHAFVPVSTDLGAEVVYDTPTNIVGLPGHQLAAWGIDVDAALAIAVDNLRASAPAPFRSVGDGVFVAAAGDCYDSARMLLTDEVARLGVDGDPVALVANRDTLVITGADRVGGLYRLLEIALQVVERPSITLQPVTLRDGRWSEWLPPPDHPMRDAFYELAIRTRGRSYAELKELLVERHARHGVDLFVAPYGLFHPADGDLSWSHAEWAPVRGWLPESDLVSVVHPSEQRYIVVPRATLLTVAGHLLDRVPEVHPPYDAFDGVPDEDTWNRLRRHAVREGIRHPGVPGRHP
ncbi:MAG: hypothetical protein ABMB14_31690 [Myxococcota bacterium]